MSGVYRRSPRYLFRVDASSAIGLGHLVRCFAIADQLITRGAEVHFVCGRQTKDFLQSLPTSKVQWHFILGSVGTSLSFEDAIQTAAIARSMGCELAIIDHYGASEDYFSELHRFRIPLGVIDDLEERKFGPIRWFLNPSQNVRPACSRVDYLARQRRGVELKLLRPEFVKARDGLHRSHTSRCNLLVSVGGGDHSNLMIDVIEAILPNTFPQETRNGKSNVLTRLNIRCLACDEFVRKRYEGIAHVTCLPMVDRMADQLCWADLAITAGGSTCWEMACLGVPMVMLELAGNQRPVIETLVSKGCGVSLGRWGIGHAEQLVQELTRLISDPWRRKKMSQCSMDLIDGEGASRAAQSLIQLSSIGVCA